MRRFDVFLAGSVVGYAEVLQEGLYYRICCRCKQCCNAVCRLIIQSGTERENLGICLLEDGEFVLFKRIPIKKIDLNNAVFQLEVAANGTSSNFYALDNEDLDIPIARLADMKFVVSEKGSGIYYSTVM